MRSNVNVIQSHTPTEKLINTDWFKEKLINSFTR